MTDRSIAGGATLHVVEDAAALATAAATMIITAAEQSVASRGVFHLCTTGGSTPAAIYAALRTPALSARMPWEKTTIWIGDDRFVPRTDANSNLASIDAVLLAAGPDGAASPLRNEQVEAWLTDAPSSADAARNYAARAASRLPLTPAGVPIFDLVLIGVGGDGHCLSVFPGSPLATSGSPLAAGVPAPTHIDPRVPRVSFSTAILAAARAVAPLAAGAAKAEILARIIEGDEPIAQLPAKAALLPNATWILDAAAASKLTGR